MENMKNGFKYIKIYSFIDIIFIIIFSLLYIYTLKEFLILFIFSFSLILTLYIFLYYNALKGKVHFIKPDINITKYKIKFIIFLGISTTLLSISFYTIKSIYIRLILLIIFIAILSIFVYNYNSKTIKVYQK